MSNGVVDQEGQTQKSWISVRLYYKLRIKLADMSFDDARDFLLPPYLAIKHPRKRVVIPENTFAIIESMVSGQLGADYDSPEVVSAEFSRHPHSELFLELSLSKHYRCHSQDYTNDKRTGKLSSFHLKQRPLKAQQRLFEEEVLKRISWPFSIEELTFNRATSRSFAIDALCDVRFELTFPTPLFGGGSLLLQILRFEQELSNSLGKDAKLQYKRLPSMLTSGQSHLVETKRVSFSVGLTCRRVIYLEECEMSGAMARITEDEQVRAKLTVKQMPQPIIAHDYYVNPDSDFALSINMDIEHVLGTALDLDYTLKNFKVLAVRVPDNYHLNGCPDTLVE